MKTIKGIITTALIMLGYSFSYAQHPTSINRADCIFEGTITQQKYYSGKYGQSCLCSIIQITKIFKGSPKIKIGNIKVITPDDRGTADAGPGLRMGFRYVIFGTVSTSLRRPIDSTTFQTMPTDNILILDCIDNIAYIGRGAKWGYRNPTQFKTVDSLYSFFKANGLEVQEEAGQTGH